MENIKTTDSSYEAKKPETVTNQQAEAILSDLGYDNWSFMSREEGTNQVTLTYSTSVSQYYQITEYLITIQYKFTPRNSWDNVSYDETQTKITWDIFGEWRYRDDTRDFYVRITDYDLENKCIKLEYILVNVPVKKEYSVYSSEETLNTNGIVERYFGEYNKYSHNVEEQDYYDFIWIYTGKESQSTIDGVGCGVNVGGYWLKKQ